MRLAHQHPLGSLPVAHAKLLLQLSKGGWLCQGTVVCRTLRRRVRGQWVQKGPYYLWTGKRQGKTVCHALSKAQYQIAKEAIDTNQKLMKTLAKLQATTLQQILNKIPGVERRK